MSGFAPQPVDDVAVATIRTLAADVVGKANSGHPGARDVYFREGTVYSPQSRCPHGHGPCRPRPLQPVRHLDTETGRTAAHLQAASSTRTRRTRSGIIVTDSSSPTGKCDPALTTHRD